MPLSISENSPMITKLKELIEKRKQDQTAPIQENETKPIEFIDTPDEEYEIDLEDTKEIPIPLYPVPGSPDTKTEKPIPLYPVPGSPDTKDGQAAIVNKKELPKTALPKEPIPLYPVPGSPDTRPKTDLDVKPLPDPTTLTELIKKFLDSLKGKPTG